MNWIDSIAQTGLAEIRLPFPVALAAVAAVGYLLGRRGHQRPRQTGTTPSDQEIERTRLVAHELEGIADKVRWSLAKHHALLARFRSRFRQDGGPQSEASWQAMRSEAEEVLGPTLQLAQEITQAYDGIRRQSRQLETFTGAGRRLSRRPQPAGTR